MKLAEITKQERGEIAYTYLLCNLRLYKQTLEKISMYRKRNDCGQLVTSFTCYLSDQRGNPHTLYFRLHHEQYLWFICAVQEDFPDVAFEDLTPEEFKLVKTDGGESNDVQTGEES